MHKFSLTDYNASVACFFYSSSKYPNKKDLTYKRMLYFEIYAERSACK